jgi:NAD(P)-dependent dehydrogenase (short-subunit alcohol dehydrogenase family)
MSGVILVTGASRGIGAAVARLAGSRGYAVGVNYRRGAEEAKEVVADIRMAGSKAVAVEADVARETEVERLFATVEAELGPLTALVANAGITGGMRRVEDINEALVEQVLAVNVTGCILCAREAVRRFSTKRGGKGGAIVTVSSIASTLGAAGEYVHYAASKGAVDSFTIGLAREVAGEGIRVNAVNPGLIKTGIHAAAGAPDRVDRLAATIPMGRGGEAIEVAEAVLWLLSDAASYVTGALVPVCGGR